MDLSRRVGLQLWHLRDFAVMSRLREIYLSQKQIQDLQDNFGTNTNGKAIFIYSKHGYDHEARIILIPCECAFCPGHGDEINKERYQEDYAQSKSST